jgi:hypothetical protein
MVRICGNWFCFISAFVANDLHDSNEYNLSYNPIRALFCFGFCLFIPQYHQISTEE